MTQVSKRLMAKRLEEKVAETFWEVVAKLNKKSETELFFSELFSRVEKINFVKRLSVVVLLYKGFEWRQICDFLKVSPSTVGKMALKMKSDGFNLLFKKIEREEEWRNFWKELGKFYLTVTHGDKVARLGDEGVENIYFKRRKNSLI